MDLRQLEYVVAVADHGGFSAGARALLVSQPSLSHGVKTLEHELGVEIFARLGRTVSITAPGEGILDAARGVIASMAVVRATAAAARDVLAGRLDIVALPTLAVDPLATLIGRFRSQYPGVSVRVVEPDDARSLEHAITAGTAEIGLSDIASASRGLARIPLYRQQFLAVCPPGSVGGREVLSATDLAAMALVATPVGTSTRRLLDQVLARTKADPQIAVEVQQREAIVPLVLAGSGATLLPASVAAQARTRGADVVPMRPSVSRPVGLVHRTGALSPAAAAFIVIATADAADRR